jgi:peptidoglycan/xylan/chitin deacetylase (PgdA/CDA1 family)
VSRARLESRLHLYGLGLWLLLLACGAADGRAVARHVEAWERPDAFAARWGVGELETVQQGSERWLRFTTPGDGSIALVAPAAALAPPLDLRGRYLRVRVRVENTAGLAGMELRLSSDDHRASFFAFDVPLFADPSFNLLQPGDWLTLTFSFGSARSVGSPDRAAIDSIGWVVSDRADPDTGAPRPVALEWSGVELVDEAPRGIVSFTFDDGYDEHYAVAAPVLEAHGFQGTAYVMPDQVGAPGYMTLAQLEALRDRYRWTVAAHHVTPFTELGSRLESEVAGVQRFLSANGFADGARHLAYPLGKLDTERVLPLVRDRFATARLASGGTETLPPGDRHRLRALNVLQTTRPEEIRDAAERASRNGEWLLLMFHFLVERPARDTEYAIDDFRRAVVAIDGVDVDVRTVTEVWRHLFERDPEPESAAR